MRITGSSTARSTPKESDAHSLYVETLAELGPIGLALLSAALVVPLVAAVRARRHPLSVPADSVALVDPRRLLARVARGDLANVSFPICGGSSRRSGSTCGERAERPHLRPPGRPRAPQHAGGSRSGEAVPNWSSGTL